MATAAVTTTLVNGTANSATPVNGNFTDLVTFLNNSVVHRDGSKSFTGAVDMGASKITGLGSGTVSTDAVNKGQLDVAGTFVCTSSTRPGAPTQGRVIYETDTGLVYIYNGTGWEQVGGTGGWASFVPQLDQGVSTNIAKTVNYSKWTRGPQRTITWTFSLSPTASGTSGTAITLTLPVAAASVSGVYGGGGNYFDTGTANYLGYWRAQSTTKIEFVIGSTGTLFGLSAAVASGDGALGSITYEAAT